MPPILIKFLIFGKAFFVFLTTNQQHSYGLEAHHQLVLWRLFANFLLANLPCFPQELTPGYWFLVALLLTMLRQRTLGHTCQRHFWGLQQLLHQHLKQFHSDFTFMLQARFQAQQLMEREQKLINILEERQEEAIRRIAYNNRDSVHSANSLSSTNSNSASGSSGSSYNSNQHHHRRAVVRSAADMHTSPIGWDKSYPLRPMDPGLPPTEQPHPPIPRTPSSVGLYKRNSTAGLTSSNMGNKYSGGYGPKGHYASLRNRGLSLDRLQNGNPGSLQTSPTRRPSYGLTRTRSQAQLLGHSSGEDSYASSSRPPSTYDAYRYLNPS